MTILNSLIARLSISLVGLVSAMLGQSVFARPAGIDTELIEYAKSVARQIDKAYERPVGVGGMLESTMVFTIRADGSLMTVRNERPSDSDLLDRAAQNAIPSNAKFPPFPEALRLATQEGLSRA